MENPTQFETNLTEYNKDKITTACIFTKLILDNCLIELNGIVDYSINDSETLHEFNSRIEDIIVDKLHRKLIK